LYCSPLGSRQWSVVEYVSFSSRCTGVPP
jgi:hypothetical protein